MAGGAIGTSVVGLGLALAACGGGVHVNSLPDFPTTTTSTSTTSARSGGPKPTVTSTTVLTGADAAGSGADEGTGEAGAAASGVSPPAGGSGAGTSTTESGLPGPARPPTPGAYDYKSTDGRGVVTQLQVTYQPDGGSGGTTDQTETISSSGGSGQSRTYAWSATSVLIGSSTLSGQYGSIDCSWSPAVSGYVFPLRIGAQWSSTSNCTTTVDGEATHVQDANTASVSGVSTIEEAGQTLETWVINRQTVLTATSSTFSLKIDTVSTEYFAPADGQTPREASTTRTTGEYRGKSVDDQTRATIEAETLSPS